MFCFVTLSFVPNDSEVLAFLQPVGHCSCLLHAHCSLSNQLDLMFIFNVHLNMAYFLIKVTKYRFRIKLTTKTGDCSVGSD